MHRAASAPIRTLLWRRRAASLLLNDSRAALLSRSAQLLSSSSSRGFASLPEGVEELTMPALSPTMTVGNISAWLKKEGEQLQAGDVLCQIETDKAVVDYEMQDEAVLAAIVLPEGTPDIPVGGVLAYTVEDMETYESLLSSGALKALKDAPSASASGSAAPVADTPSPVAAATPAPAAHAGRQPLIKFLGKRSLLLEAEHAATPAAATTSAPAAAAATPVAAPAAAPATAPATEAGDDFTDIALSNMRKIIAKRLTASKVTVPHHYASIDCEIDNIMKLRQKLKSAHSVKVSLNDFIIKAVALALRDVPEANCYFDVATKGVQPNKSVDISVAVATAAGLITPIVPKVDTIGLSGVNSIFMELVSRARQNKLKPEEFQGGSFTISNLGGFGIDNFTAVINPPQACIMAIGRGRKEVLPPLEIVEGVDPEPRVATLMNVTLSADRRVVDDVISGQFLQVFKSYMENPELMVLAFGSRAPFLNKKSPTESRPAVQHLSSMSELQLIVEQLNKEPFRLGLTLVAFDEKSNFELLQILNEVFTEIDTKHNVDLRNEADEQRAYRYLEFLQLLKFPLPRDVESFREALIHGDRQVLYPILHWALKNLAGHKKRAYLGRFLAPLNVPQEYFGNETLNGMYEHYKQLQEQFKAVHKEVDQLRASKTRPGELRKEITQLEEEAQQLQEKIANLKKKTASESGFKDILEATSALRKEQEEQAKLAERKRDQMMSLTLVEKRSRECEQRLMDLRSSLSHDTPPEQLFEHLKSQVERNRDILVVKFPQEFRLQQENLQRLERALSEPPKTEADIADMEDEIASLKSSIQHFQAQIVDAQKNSGGDDKLGIYRQHASVQVKKLAAKEDELDALRTEKAKMQKQIEELEAKMSEVSGGAKFMSRDEFKQYANSLRNKTNQYKKVKVELAELTAESVVLHRTEQLLKSKDADLDGFLKDMEAKKGVTGFLDTQEKLDNISEMNAQVNKLKGETLEEISRIVTDINQTLKERKNQLAPQIKELRAVRQRYQEMEQSYLEKKAQYDNTAVGLETERIKLEQECNAFQEDCLREESQYHLLHCLLQIEQGKVDKIEQEMAFENGDGHLLRDIKSFQELYKHKVAQQESFTKELRKQQKTLKSNTADYHAQREQFEGLFKLLSCKVKLAGRAGAEAAAMTKAGELFDGHADIAQFENVGGANVMTLDA